MKIKKIYCDNKILLIILAGSLIVSLAYSFYFRIIPAVDARAYDVIATNIADGAGYREDLNRDIAADQSIARVGPLYEYFLAGIYKIFGHHYGVVWVTQGILHAFTAWFVYLICLSVFNNNEHKNKIGLLAAALIGFSPDLIEISAMLMTETFYLFLISLMLYLFFKYFENKNWLTIVFLAFISGLAILARPPALFLMPIILFYFYVKKGLRSTLLFLVVFSMVFIPWTVRNYSVFHQFMPLGIGGQYNFWIGNYPGANGEQVAPVEASNFIAAHPLTELSAESVRQFKIFIVHHPVEFFKLTLERISKYFSLIRPMGFWFYQHGVGQLIFVVSSGIFQAILFVFGLAGIIRAIRRKDEKLRYLIAFAAATPLILFITVVESRYRFQIYPLLAVFAGYCFIGLAQNKHWFTDKMLWASITVLFLNAMLDFCLSIEIIKEKLKLFIS